MSILPDRKATAPVHHLLLDRDGVLNHEAPDGGWVGRPEDWRWQPGALDGLRLAARAGIRVSIITNQSGIGRGVISAEQVEAVHRRMIADTVDAGGRIDAIFVCPHAPDAGCSCRKPAPGLVQEAVDAAGIPLSKTVLIGDAARDLEAAKTVGVRALLVRTGKGARTEQDLADPEARVFDTLREAIAGSLTPTNEPTSIITVERIEHQFAEHRRVLEESSRTLPRALGDVISAAWASLCNGGTILVCGNGGSAADAQHLVAELVCRFHTDRRALRATALTTDTSTLTAIANDYGYENVFSRQIEGLARPGDLLVAISTSGRSPNVVSAARTARKKGCTVVAMTGRDGGDLASLADHLLAAPTDVVSRIQEIHALCIHVLAQALEDRASISEDNP